MDRLKGGYRIGGQELPNWVVCAVFPEYTLLLTLFLVRGEEYVKL